jgi:hypothetical protein
MLPSLIGIIASSGGAAAGGDFESIATVTVGSGGASSVVFSSIPSTYKHLQIRYISRTSSTNANPEGDLAVVYGSPHAGNGYAHILYGNGSSAGAFNSGGVSYSQYASYTTTASQTANAFAAGVLDVLDYSNTNKLKTWRTLGGWDANGSGFISLSSGIHNDTSAITSISFGMNSGANFAQYSSFALYGIKG